MAQIGAVNAINSALAGLGKENSGNGAVEGPSFSSILKDTIDRSEAQNTQSNVDLLNLLSGNTDDLSGIMIDAQKAELAVSLTASIRNKAMDAYKEIMAMQV